MNRLAVFSSGNGTNLQSFIDAEARGDLKNTVLACLVTNKTHCGAVQRAQMEGLPVYEMTETGEAFDRKALKILEKERIDVIALGGFNRKIGPSLVSRYRGRMVNIHPSLLPKFTGLFGNAIHKAVLEAGETESGITIHHVDDTLDGGPVMCQKRVAVEPHDTAESLKAKIQKLEAEWYPKIVDLIKGAAV